MGLSQPTVDDHDRCPFHLPPDEHPVVYPGNPLCQFVRIDEAKQRIIEAQSGWAD